MDMRTGKIYENFEDAIKDGVPESDIAMIDKDILGEPIVKFKNGPFKNREYKRNLSGQLVRVK